MYLLNVVFLLAACTIHEGFPETINVINGLCTPNAVSGLTTFCPKVSCGASEMEVAFQVSDLKILNVDINNIHFHDRTCLGYVENGLVIVKTPVLENACGTTLTTGLTNAIYKNSIRLLPDPAKIIYREEIIVDISCKYPLNINTSMWTTLKPIISIKNISIEGGGEFSVIMAAFRDGSYLTPFKDSEISLSTKSTLYVGVFIFEGDTVSFYLEMKNCFATPSNNYFDPLKFYIIQDSCPNPKDETIHVIGNGISKEGKFSVQMFKFIGDYRYVYLHCEVHLCDNRGTSSCKPVCPKSTSRGAGQDSKNVMTLGPILNLDRMGSVPDSAERASYLSIITLAGILLSSFSLL